MKKLIQITTVLLFFVQAISYGQTETTGTETDTKKQITKTEVEATNMEKFIGTYYLAEADFRLEIVKENDRMYIISPFSKDILIQKNKSTLNEPTRGINLELITDDTSALKYTQNGYETTMKRVATKTEY